MESNPRCCVIFSVRRSTWLRTVPVTSPLASLAENHTTRLSHNPHWTRPWLAPFSRWRMNPFCEQLGFLGRYRATKVISLFAHRGVAREIFRQHRLSVGCLKCQTLKWFSLIRLFLKLHSRICQFQHPIAWYCWCHVRNSLPSSYSHQQLLETFLIESQLTLAHYGCWLIGLVEICLLTN